MYKKMVTASVRKVGHFDVFVLWLPPYVVVERVI